MQRTRVPDSSELTRPARATIVRTRLATLAGLSALLACAADPSAEPGDDTGTSGAADAAARGDGGLDGRGSGLDGPDDTGAAETWSDPTDAQPVCTLQCDEGEECQLTDDGQVCACSPALCSSPSACNDDGRCSLVWPNEESFANSDPWLAAHHQEIEQMRPRILALNYVNHRSMEEMHKHLDALVGAMAEGSRYHKSAIPDAAPSLQPELAYEIDLRDAEVPPLYPRYNSTLYPRESPKEGSWGFDYEQLFTPEYAQHIGLTAPDDPSRVVDLCEAIDTGMIHEIWVYGDGDIADDVNAAEILERKPRYDEDGNRLAGEWDRCAGNGCFDDEDFIPCERTVRVVWINNNRGIGCAMESLSHGIEHVGRRFDGPLPYLSRYLPEFAGFDLDEKYGDQGVDVVSWYQCPYGEPCLSYPDETTVAYNTGLSSGSIVDYDPVCGNAHFPPNGRQHYDLDNTAPVLTTCEHWRDGKGATEIYDASRIADNHAIAPDCDGPFLVWWWQNIPGFDNTSIDDHGQAMLNWWPFLYY